MNYSRKEPSFYSLRQEPISIPSSELLILSGCTEIESSDHEKSTPFYPQGNGQAESTNRDPLGKRKDFNFMRIPLGVGTRDRGSQRVLGHVCRLFFCCDSSLSELGSSRIIPSFWL
ncbi:hypothetical protein CUMW_273780 [Citrus unshiu]|uniref:Uncharacterized protein n=2 Tax=Citrus TaxID=2706 RepID=A0A067D318_CITSI|nr:hypothetical protein CISIN_1g046433mg [Citrus sinensis]GAY32479.1 hypothetical protein CUMW_273780 [Citrus unshiu]